MLKGRIQQIKKIKIGNLKTKPFLSIYLRQWPSGLGNGLQNREHVLRGFESFLTCNYNGDVAQLVERQTEDLGVGGSNPPITTKVNWVLANW
jgi:hypothetical protein